MMTADVKLLPLPEALFETGSLRDLFNVAQMQGYARANVAHATAAQAAEIEALLVRVDAIAGEAIKHEARAERLAETLRAVVADMREWGEPAKGAHVERIQRRLDDALRDHDQEVK